SSHVARRSSSLSLASVRRRGGSRKRENALTAAPSPAGGLASLELGRAPLDEGGEAFIRVLRGPREQERAPLERDPGGQGSLEGLVDRLLGEPDRKRALRRDLARNPLRLVEPGFPGDDACDQAELERLGRAEHAAGEDQVHRDGLADGASQTLGAA